MKLLKKLMVVFAAVLMVMSLTSRIYAEGSTTTAPSDGEIKITPPANTQSSSKNTYKLYKVFSAETDGTNYSYKLSGAHTSVPNGFILDDAGNVYFAKEAGEGDTDTFVVTVNGVKKTLVNKTVLGAADIAAIAAYVTDADLVATKEVTGTNPADFTGLAYGYYYVTTTTGTLVVIDSTKPLVDVVDKNEVPSLDKKITAADSIVDDEGKEAIAQVGHDVEYTLTVTKKKGAENYTVYDNIGAGLVYKGPLTVKVGTSTVDASNYVIKTESSNSLVVEFKNNYISGLDDNTVITLSYFVTVTEDALQTDPAKNTAWLEYGHTPGENKTPVVETKTYNAKFSVTKKDGQGQPLAGAGFVLMNQAGKYYKFTAGTAATETKPATPDSVAWVDSIDDATEYTSQAGTGKLNGEFTGLCNGKYTLVEKTVPTGYNPAADYSFEVKEKDVSEANLIQSTEVVNNKGAELPSTGGIGTTIFHIAGAALVLGAGILLISKKRMNNN